MMHIILCKYCMSFCNHFASKLNTLDERTGSYFFVVKVYVVYLPVDTEDREAWIGPNRWRDGRESSVLIQAGGKPLDGTKP